MFNQNLKFYHSHNSWSCPKNKHNNNQKKPKPLQNQRKGKSDSDGKIWASTSEVYFYTPFLKKQTRTHCIPVLNRSYNIIQITADDRNKFSDHSTKWIETINDIH